MSKDPRTQNREWLLVRGLARAKDMWLDFPAKLQKKFPEEKVTTLDLPGNGSLNHLRSPLRIGEYTDSLRLQFKKSAEQVQMVAMSLGAMAAVDWMERFPGELNKSYLINTSCANLVQIQERLQPRMMWQLLKIAAQPDLRQQELLILEMVSLSKPRQEQLLQDIVTISERQPVRFANLVRQLWAAAGADFPLQAPGAMLI